MSIRGKYECKEINNCIFYFFLSEKDVLSTRWPKSLRLLGVAFGVVVVINFPAVTYIERYAYGL